MLTALVRSDSGAFITHNATPELGVLGHDATTTRSKFILKHCEHFLVCKEGPPTHPQTPFKILLFLDSPSEGAFDKLHFAASAIKLSIVRAFLEIQH